MFGEVYDIPKWVCSVPRNCVNCVLKLFRVCIVFVMYLYIYIYIYIYIQLYIHKEGDIFYFVREKRIPTRFQMAIYRRSRCAYNC